jgi:hypothetical protein
MEKNSKDFGAAQEQIIKDKNVKQSGNLNQNEREQRFTDNVQEKLTSDNETLTAGSASKVGQNISDKGIAEQVSGKNLKTNEETYSNNPNPMY